MRFSVFAAVALGLTFGAHRAFAAPDSRCGGDGPSPFFDISIGLPKVLPLTLNGPIADFTQNGDTLNYRNERNQIFTHSLSNKKHEYLGNSQVPLSSVPDQENGAILLQGAAHFYLNRLWQSFYTSADQIEHLFWERDALYMLDMKPGTVKYSQELRISRFLLGMTFARNMCRALVPVGETYLLGKGAAFPIVPFYRVRPIGNKTELAIFEMDVRNCNVTHYGTYLPFDAKILSVHRFSANGSYATHTTHPTKNLLWDYHSGCEYYNVGNEPLLVPNYSRPIVAKWNAANGLELMNLTTRSRASYDAPTMAATLRPRDISLGDRGSRLLIAPDSLQTNGRFLFEIDAKDVLQ